MSPLQRARPRHSRRPAPAIADARREFAFSDADFRSLAQLAYEHAGIALADSKRNLVYSRLSRRLRALGCARFGDTATIWRNRVKSRASSTRSRPTSPSSFARRTTSTIFAPMSRCLSCRRRMAPRVGRLRIWSAGCSTGEEPYTIAVVLRREIRDIERHDVRILATDIDTDIIAKAARGEYPANSSTNSQDLSRLLQAGEAARRRQCGDGRRVRKLIAFRRLNLMEPWPFKGLFDAIFCRNVMIYFDAATKTTLVERFTQQIKPGGWLYIGHSESLIGSHPGLRLVGRTIYRRDA